MKKIINKPEDRQAFVYRGQSHVHRRSFHNRYADGIMLAVFFLRYLPEHRKSNLSVWTHNRQCLISWQLCPFVPDPLYRNLATSSYTVCRIQKRPRCSIYNTLAWAFGFMYLPST